MTLDQALTDVSRLGFDTAPIIYFVEANPKYDAVVAPVFDRIGRHLLRGCTSMITLTEVLVHPLAQGRDDLAQQYRELLLASEGFETLPIEATIAARAAELRVKYGLRTPDALQIAAALEAGCEAFLTNDAGHRRVTELRVLVLDDLSAGTIAAS